MLAKDLAKENFVEFQIVHSFRVWIQGEANSDGNGKILFQIQDFFVLGTIRVMRGKAVAALLCRCGCWISHRRNREVYHLYS